MDIDNSHQQAVCSYHYFTSLLATEAASARSDSIPYYLAPFTKFRDSAIVSQKLVFQG